MIRRFILNSSFKTRRAAGTYRQYVFIYLLLFILCFLFPYSGDDWTWGSQIGIDRLNTWFANYNGRYVGNLIVLMITRSNLLKASVMALCLVVILYTLAHITHAKLALPIASLFLLLIPVSIACQAIVWSSGFANYAVSAATTLVFLRSILWVFQPKASIPGDALSQHPRSAIPMLLLGFLGSLIVEHITIYNLAASGLVLLIVAVRFHKVLIHQACYFLGCVLGSAYMFSNGAYRAISQGIDQYRTMAHDVKNILYYAVTNFFNTIQYELFMNNFFLNAAILVVLFLLYRSAKGRFSSRQQRLVVLCFGINLGYFLYAALFFPLFLGDLPWIKYCNGGATLITAAALLYLIAVLVHGHVNEYRIWFLAGSIVFLGCTLLIVTPLGSRCFFITYVLFLVLLLELLTLLPDSCQHWFSSSAAKTISTAAIAILLVMYYILFGFAYRESCLRISHIREKVAQGQTTVEIIQNRYARPYIFFHVQGNINETEYKSFYNLPKNIELIPVTQYSDGDR